MSVENDTQGEKGRRGLGANRESEVTLHGCVMCPFCGEDLAALYDNLDLDEITACPRCGAAVVFSTDTENIRRELAEFILQSDYVTREEAARMEVHLVPDVDVLLDEPGGDEVGRVHLVVGWNPDEMLSTPQVARILGLTTRRVAHLAEEGAFSGAVREPPRAGRRGFWRIPRRDVAARMVRKWQRD